MISQSPAGAIVYSLWLRTRLPLVSAIAITLACSAIGTALGPVPRACLGMGAMLAVIFGIAFLVGAVTYGGGDLSTPESIYPKHSFVFPVPTRTLVGVPMLYGTLVVALFWIVTSRAAMELVNLQKFPVIWPAAMVAAMVAWLQAASWSPYRLPFVRVGVFFFILVALLIPMGIAAQVHGVNLVYVVLFNSIVAVLAYPTALLGVSRARRGEGVGLPAFQFRIPKSPQSSAFPPPFSSGAASQLWFDLRRNIWYPPAITALVQILLFIVFVLGRKGPPSVFLPAWMPPGAVPLLALLAVPVFIAMGHAVVFGKFDMWTKSLELPAFFATRPMTTAGIVAAKLRVTTAVTVLVWPVTLIVAITFTFIPRTYDPTHSWATVLFQQPGIQRFTAIAMALLLLIILTWSQIARSLWVGLAGKPWIVHIFPTVSMLLFSGLAWAGYRINLNPPLRAALITHAATILVVLASLKLILSTALFSQLHRRSLMPPSSIARAWAIWIFACLTIFAGLLLPAPPLRHWPITLMSLVILFVPLFRPALAVLVLHYNRHR